MVVTETYGLSSVCVLLDALRLSDGVLLEEGNGILRRLDFMCISICWHHR